MDSNSVPSSSIHIRIAIIIYQPISVLGNIQGSGIRFQYMQQYFQQHGPSTETHQKCLKKTNLWCHPIWSSNHSVPFLISYNIGTKAKVSDFHSSIHSKQDIIRFDVSMNYTLKIKNKNKHVFTTVVAFLFTQFWNSNKCRQEDVFRIVLAMEMVKNCNTKTHTFKVINFINTEIL